MKRFCEEKWVFTDYQYGFRENRACRDALFVLSGIEERRGKRKVYCGFLAIAKAYPSVWRKGLWYKLMQVGIDGNMWKVLKAMHAKCEVGQATHPLLAAG